MRSSRTSCVEHMYALRVTLDKNVRKFSLQKKIQCAFNKVSSLDFSQINFTVLNVRMYMLLYLGV